MFVDEQEAHAALAEDSTALGELRWGKQLKGVRISLPAAAPERVAELLEESWRRRAPKRLVAAFDAARAGERRRLLERLRRTRWRAGRRPRLGDLPWSGRRDGRPSVTSDGP